MSKLQPGRPVFGHWIEYNGAAAEDAEARVRTFLTTHLEPAAAQQPQPSEDAACLG